jgi:hypothetical protein
LILVTRIFVLYPVAPKTVKILDMLSIENRLTVGKKAIVNFYLENEIGIDGRCSKIEGMMLNAEWEG